jgi:regulator of protease activity HflC (stomatin/prohibitin superfamily)
MKRINLFLLFVLAVFVSACSKVPAGHVGVKVYLLGGQKGVESEQLGVGRYWIGINEELYLFPTFTQNYVWTKSITEGSPVDESITFQTIEGMSVNADVGISYTVKPDKVAAVFQKYRKQLDEITDVYLRNTVRDAFVTVASTLPVESVYGEGKADMMKAVQKQVVEQAGDLFSIEKIYLVGDLRLPTQVTQALNAKIQATQQAQAKANKVLAASITPEFVQYQALKQWNGALPATMIPGSALPLVPIK